MAQRLARLASKADSMMGGRLGEETDSEEEEEMRAVPKGALGKVGVEMLRRQLRGVGHCAIVIPRRGGVCPNLGAARAGEDEYSREATGKYESVVDQSQFRNTQVGVRFRPQVVICECCFGCDAAGVKTAAVMAPAPVEAKRKRPEPEVVKDAKKAKKEKKDKKKKGKKKDEKKAKKKKSKKKDTKKKIQTKDDADAASSASSTSDDEADVDAEDDDVEEAEEEVLPPQTEDDMGIQLARLDALLEQRRSKLRAAKVLAAPAPEEKASR